MEPRAIIHRVASVDYINVADRPAPETPRYNVGDYAVVLVENLILPKWLLECMDLWNHEKNKGYLAGSQGNRTKARRVAGVLSQVSLCKINWLLVDYKDCKYVTMWLHGTDNFTQVCMPSNDATPDKLDVTDWLQIKPYTPK
jgi:hypothetical protein